VSYDENLAARIRGVLAKRTDVVEKKMFGGLCFMVNGAMCCGLTKTDFMVRVGPDQYDDALAQSHARPMDFTGRPLAGMVYVAPEGTRSAATLAKWIARGVSFVSSLPPKAAKKSTSGPAAKKNAETKGASRSARASGKDPRVTAPKAKGTKTAQGKSTTQLLVAMTGKASGAKAAEGDEPVFAYIASLPHPQREVAERIDALAAETLPGLQRAVKWGMAYYGVDGGWCFSSGAFVGHVKLMFIRGTEIKPEPPVTPIGMGKATRGVEPASVDDLDVRQAASWMKQAAAIPFFGGKKRTSNRGRQHAGASKSDPRVERLLRARSRRVGASSNCP
jgi:TfoX/Sxy family transcriptional regulator of competence genes